MQLQVSLTDLTVNLPEGTTHALADKGFQSDDGCAMSISETLLKKSQKFEEKMTREEGKVTSRY